MVPCKSTAKEVSFEWSHHRISSTDSKVRTTLHVSISDWEYLGVNAQHGLLVSGLFRIQFYSLNHNEVNISEEESLF